MVDGKSPQRFDPCELVGSFTPFYDSGTVNDIFRAEDDCRNDFMVSGGHDPPPFRFDFGNAVNTAGECKTSSLNCP